MTMQVGEGPDVAPVAIPVGVAEPPQRLIGVEEELLLVDAESFLPLPVSGEILGAGPLVLPNGSTLETEVKREQIEVVSPPLLSHEELLSALLAGRRAADAAAQEHGARAVALATATDLCTPHLVHAPRYERMQKRFGLTMDEQLTCGMHVHVTVSSREEGVAVLDRIRPWLPVLLALSANSPFWRGVDSGFASYRYQAWSRWPCTGPYELFGSAAGYDDSIREILATGVALDEGMIYFDARLSSHAPTVEVRIADVCLSPEDAVTVAVLIRALVERAVADGKAGAVADDVPTALLRLASWRASRWGLAQDLINPLTHRPCAARACVLELLAHVQDHFASEEESAAVRRGVSAILKRGNGATQQRRMHAKGLDVSGVVAGAVARTHSEPRG
ncbi:glutamate--cysteine ligase [Microbacterium sp.]|uniref:carboxylate-amine ligase n=1 Tax=Microbacterium sp. TaxID=51671 RepID=UPI0028128C7D|nr:glutamate--cysteine ligase [Microbacterium sp.]